jgi:HCOMODA/2-hydroxy-3-carboxy-muconic semialdehyde decarboxylase
MIRLLARTITALAVLVAAPALAQAPASVDAAIDDLVVANRILAERGIIDAYGHVSIRHPADPQRYLMARALSPALITAPDIMEFDLNSNPIDRRDRSLFSERFIHGEIYKVRPDVNAVVHTHSAGVIPFGITQVPLKPVLHTASFLWVGVPIFEIREAGGVTNMLVSNDVLGKALAATLGDKPVALMRGHGNVVVGQNVQQAVIRAVYTDENARLQATALAFGGPINYISPEEGALRDKEPGDVRGNRAWQLWKALAMRKAQP